MGADGLGLIEASSDAGQDWYRLEIGSDRHRQCATRKIMALGIETPPTDGRSRGG
jgi:hypothetical protein